MLWAELSRAVGIPEEQGGLHFTAAPPETPRVKLGFVQLKRQICLGPHGTPEGRYLGKRGHLPNSSLMQRIFVKIKPAHYEGSLVS